MPAERVWILLTSEQNREHAWGFKVRATPVRWRPRNEAFLLAAPLDNGWETMQLLCEEVPEQMLHPTMLANMLRYLQHGACRSA